MFQPRKFNRRKLLNALGLGTGSLYLPSLIGGRGVLGDRKVYANPPPVRFAVMHSQHGPPRDRWNMAEGNLPGRDNWSRVLEPLKGHAEKLIVIEGLDNEAAYANSNINPHNRGNANILTGGGMSTNNNGQPGSISIDQKIAKKIAREDRFPYQYWQTWNAWSPVHDGDQQLSAERRPGAPGKPYSAVVFKPLKPGTQGQNPSSASTLRQAFSTL